VALPAFKLVARAFPSSLKYFISHFPKTTKEVTADLTLGPMGLIDGHLQYPVALSNPKHIFKLFNRIRKLNFDIAIYIGPPRGCIKAIRDAMFFKLCGIRYLIGFPVTPDRQRVRQLSFNRLWESEASRLCRCISILGDAKLNDPESWYLEITEKEQKNATSILVKNKVEIFIAASIGTKADTKYWGTDNWKTLFKKWSGTHSSVGLVLIGSSDEYQLSREIGFAWHGHSINLCGILQVREAAAIIEKAVFFVGHDSGPMHLAASVNTPCIAIFSARNKPGEWFPFGNNNRVIYHQTPCFGCGLSVCNHLDKICIRSITVDEVYHTMNEMWNIVFQ